MDFAMDYERIIKEIQGRDEYWQCGTQRGSLEAENQIVARGDCTCVTRLSRHLITNLYQALHLQLAAYFVTCSTLNPQSDPVAGIREASKGFEKRISK